MAEERKYAIFLSATRNLTELGDEPSPAREACIANSISNAETLMRRIDDRWPAVRVRGKS
jgi:hypothetical protein